MANQLRVLGQVAPSAIEPATLYTVPSGATAVISSVVVCNRSAVSTSFRIAIRVSGSSLSDKQYIYYDLPITGNDTFIATIGITLSALDVVTVYTTLATTSFTLFGQEHT